MGIHDRHYVRNAPPPRGFGGPAGGPRAWSVTTWLIVICVGVFLLDQFVLPKPHMVPTGRYEPATLRQYSPKQLELVYPVYVNPPYLSHLPSVSGVWVRVRERATGQDRGFAEVIPMQFLAGYLHFSTGMLLDTPPGNSWLPLPRLEFWRLIGFQFLHANFFHLFVNMLGLYFFGPIVEERLGRKRYLAFYLLCGICGALMYMLLNLGGLIAAEIAHRPIAIPGLLFSDMYTPLIGASAGVFGVLMAGAFLMPRTEVLLFFILPIQLRTLAYALVAIALYSIITGTPNAGGEASHLGGAIAGFYFIRRQHHLHGFFDFLGRVDPTSHHYRNRQRQGQRQGTVLRRPPGPERTAEVDRILAKISQHGIHSLTEQEKRTLRDASQ